METTMVNRPPPFNCLNVSIPIMILLKGKRFINQGSGLRSAKFSWGGEGHGVAAGGSPSGEAGDKFWKYWVM